SVVTATVSGTEVNSIVSTVTQTIQLPQVTFTVTSDEVKLVYPPATSPAVAPPAGSTPPAVVVPTTLATSVRASGSAIPSNGLFTGSASFVKPATGFIAA